MTAQDCAGGGLSIEGVTLAVAASAAAVTAVDLDNSVSGAAQETGEANSVAAGALNSVSDDAAVAGQGSGPCFELGVSLAVGCDVLGRESSAEVVQGDRDVYVLMGVNADRAAG